MTQRAAFWNALATLVTLGLIFFLIDPAGRAPDGARFLARQHPALVHLPIGFLLFAGLVALGRWWRKDDQPGGVEQTALLLGGWGGVAAAAAGSWLMQMGGYPTDVMFWHRAFGLIIPLAAAGILLFNLGGFPRPMVATSWTLLVASIVMGGHMGGELTHGKAFSTEYAPGILKPVLGEAPSLDTRFDLSRPDSSTVYEVLVAPILGAKCTSCHGEGRTKGGLDLTTPETIAAHETDTEDDPLITWGASDASLLIQRVMLPVEHRRAMPPVPESAPLSHADVELLTWWVNSESGFDGTIASADMPGSIRTILQAYGMSEIKTGVFALNVTAPDTALVSNLTAAGLRLSRISVDQPFFDLVCESASCLRAEGIDDLAPNIISVDLAGTDLADANLAVLQRFPHLTSLDLSRTGINGRGLEVLSGLAYLARINLYGTQVDDALLDVLASFPALEAVYLWETDVTAEGVARLRDALPDTEINDGRS